MRNLLSMVSHSNTSILFCFQKVKHSKLAEDIERLVNEDKQMLPQGVDSDNVSHQLTMMCII